jgi:DNA-binding NarL/FixJ family response regulator
MSSAIRILIAEDHPLMRSGIATEISSEPDLEVVAVAEDGQQAVELFRSHYPDVSLIDLRLPKMNGLQVIETIRRERPTARIIVLTTAAGDVHAVRAFKAGAASYLLKHMLRDELIHAIREVHAGRKRIPAEIAKIIAESALAVEVLSKVAEGLSNKEIAARLFISEYTVKAHLKTILLKLGANDRTHAVMIALQRGFLDAS